MSDVIDRGAKLAAEGLAINAIGTALVGLTPEEACRVMAIACVHASLYVEAIEFLRAAQWHRADDERKVDTERRATANTEPPP